LDYRRAVRYRKELLFEDDDEDEYEKPSSTKRVA
jgi:hypothetical protein